MGGDQEQAYILYMRFIDMYKIIRSSKDYKKDKTEITQLLPTSKVHRGYLLLLVLLLFSVTFVFVP